MIVTSLPRAVSLLCLCGLALSLPVLPAGEPSRPRYKVTVHDETKTETAGVTLPIDPTQRIRIGMGVNGTFGLSVQGKRITFSTDGGSVQTMVKIDNQAFVFGDPNQGKYVEQQKPLGKGPQGQARIGNRSTWEARKVRISQILEVVPSRPGKNAASGSKRRLDVCRATYVIENKDSQPHEVGLRVGHDIYVVDNDGAQFAAPTVPGKVLNGYLLKGKELPEYVQVLQRPDLKNPLYVTHFTFKMGTRIEGPEQVSLTGLGACFGGYDIPAMASGDTAIGIFFGVRKMNPGAKREVGYAYGEGLATNPDNEGKVGVAVAGSFEPGKQFAVTALVEDPVQGQTLTLELPEGMELLEGKALQPVPLAVDVGASLVAWKARVLKPGTYAVRVRSSTGAIHTKNVTISLAERGPPR